MKKITLFVLLVLCLLSGCNDKLPSVSANSTEDDDLKVQISQLEIENEQLNARIKEKNQQVELEKEALRTTMNLSLKLLSAMNTSDFEFITSVASEEVQVNKADNKLQFTHETSVHEISLEGNYLLENLEFRFYDLDGEKMTLGFAHHFFEGHGTMYFQFVNHNGEWLLHSFVTNA